MEKADDNCRNRRHGMHNKNGRKYRPRWQARLLERPSTKPFLVIKTLGLKLYECIHHASHLSQGNIFLLLFFFFSPHFVANNGSVMRAFSRKRCISTRRIKWTFPKAHGRTKSSATKSISVCLLFFCRHCICLAILAASPSFYSSACMFLQSSETIEIRVPLLLSV